MTNMHPDEDKVVKVSAVLCGIILSAFLCGMVFSQWNPWKAYIRKDIYIDCSITIGKIRNLLGINNGPLTFWRDARGDFFVDLSTQYKELGIKSVRVQDFSGIQAGPFDIDQIFPDFNADPESEGNYNFTSTDLAVQGIKSVGADIIFRLGYSWGFGKAKASVTYINESDYVKWAEIAKHIVMHYNDGWANGFHYNITYWEIWNEPDNEVFWTGTSQEFYKLYEVTARTLKAYNSSLKVGGPALAFNMTFLEGFLKYCKERNVPLDFVSWHYYDFPPLNPYEFYLIANQIQKYLNHFGFNLTQNLLTEWGTHPSHGLLPTREPAKTAAYTASALIYMQNTTLVMANRWGTTGPLGMFNDDGSFRKIAYAFKALRIMLDTPLRLKCAGSDSKGFAVLAGKSFDNKTVCILVSNFNSGDTDYNLFIENLPWGNQSFQYKRYVVDASRNFFLIESEIFVTNGFLEIRRSLPESSLHLIILKSSN